MTLAVAGAIITRSAWSATAMCSTWKEKFRSKVSTSALLPVSVSKVTAVINCVAFWVMSTCTLHPNFTRAEARLGILYAAIPPVTPSTTVFPCNIAVPPLSAFGLVLV